MLLRDSAGRVPGWNETGTEVASKTPKMNVARTPLRPARRLVFSCSFVL